MRSDGETRSGQASDLAWWLQSLVNEGRAIVSARLSEHRDTTIQGGCPGIGTRNGIVSRTVLDVTYLSQTSRADNNLRENLSMLSPKPKHWKLDLSLRIDRVENGDFGKKKLNIHWLRGLIQAQYAVRDAAPE